MQHQVKIGLHSPNYRVLQGRCRRRTRETLGLSNDRGTLNWYWLAEIKIALIF